MPALTLLLPEVRFKTGPVRPPIVLIVLCGDRALVERVVVTHRPLREAKCANPLGTAHPPPPLSCLLRSQHSLFSLTHTHTHTHTHISSLLSLFSLFSSLLF